jgi:hypothetical protein
MKTSILVSTLALCMASARAEQKSINVRCIIGNGKNAITLQSANPHELAATKTVHSPTEWDLPVLKPLPDGPLIVPLTPNQFKAIETGWTIQFSAEPVGDLIKFIATATYIKPDLKKAVYGEHSTPIYSTDKKKILLSENKAQSISTLSSTYQFQIFAKPGQKYDVELRQLDKWVPAHITCDFIASK